MLNSIKELKLRSGFVLRLIGKCCEKACFSKFCYTFWHFLFFYLLRIILRRISLVPRTTNSCNKTSYPSYTTKLGKALSICEEGGINLPSMTILKKIWGWYWEIQSLDWKIVQVKKNDRNESSASFLTLNSILKGDLAEFGNWKILSQSGKIMIFYHSKGLNKLTRVCY